MQEVGGSIPPGSTIPSTANADPGHLRQALAPLVAAASDRENSLARKFRICAAGTRRTAGTATLPCRLICLLPSLS
jgi:hypothetical protein